MFKTVKYNNWSAFVASITESKASTIILDSLEIVNQTQEQLPNDSNKTLETLIIDNLIFIDVFETGDMFNCFSNLKVLEIHNLIAPKTTACSLMFAHLKVNYLNLNLDFSNAEAANYMFYNCSVSAKCCLKLKFSNKLKYAENMFANWQTLTPNNIDTLITYDANTSNIFDGCCYSSALIAKLNENNRLAKLTPEQKQAETMETMLTNSINKLVAQRLDSIAATITQNANNVEHLIANNNQITNERLTTVDNRTNIIEDKFTKKLEETNMVIRRASEETTRTTDSLKQNLSNVRDSLTSQQRQLSSKQAANDSAIMATAQIVQNLVNLTSRLEDVIEDMGKRINSLEHPPEFPKPKMSQDEVRNLVRPLISELWLNHASNESYTTPNSKKFQQLVYDAFQDKYGWERIEFVVLRRIISAECLREHNRLKQPY